MTVLIQFKIEPELSTCSITLNSVLTLTPSEVLQWRMIVKKCLPHFYLFTLKKTFNVKYNKENK